MVKIKIKLSIRMRKKGDFKSLNVVWLLLPDSKAAFTLQVLMPKSDFLTVGYPIFLTTCLHHLLKVTHI